MTSISWECTSLSLLGQPITTKVVSIRRQCVRGMCDKQSYIKLPTSVCQALKRLFLFSKRMEWKCPKQCLKTGRLGRQVLDCMYEPGVWIGYTNISKDSKHIGETIGTKFQNLGMWLKNILCRRKLYTNNLASILAPFSWVKWAGGDMKSPEPQISR